MNNWKAREFSGDRESLEQGYEVKRGDTLWEISKKTGVPVDQLMKMNGIKDPRQLRAGMKLFADAGLEGGMMRTPQRDFRRYPVPARQEMSSWSGDRGVDPSQVTRDRIASTVGPETMMAGLTGGYGGGGARNLAGVFRREPPQAQMAMDYGSRMARNDGRLSGPPVRGVDEATTISRNPARAWNSGSRMQDQNLTLDQLISMYR